MESGENYREPDLSFLIPVFNMAKTLPETLQSLSSIQQFSFEIIVINDGSTDSIQKVLEEWHDRLNQVENIRFRWVDQENRGRAHALNKGVQVASAQYINFVDADDLIDPGELVRIWRCMKSAPKDLVIGQFRIVSELGKEISRRFLDLESTKERLIRRLTYSPLSPVHLNAFLIRRDFFTRIGGMDVDIIKSQDKDLVFRLLRNTDSIQICDSFHYLYRKYSLPRMQLIRKRIDWFIYRQKMIQKNFSGLPRYGSMFLQGSYDVVKLCYEGVFRYRI